MIWLHFCLVAFCVQRTVVLVRLSLLWQNTLSKTTERKKDLLWLKVSQISVHHGREGVTEQFPSWHPGTHRMLMLAGFLLSLFIPSCPHPIGQCCRHSGWVFLAWQTLYHLSHSVSPKPGDSILKQFMWKYQKDFCCCCLFVFACNTGLWTQNSGPTPWATSPELFCDG
jgi:protein-S-isoprenylcysteine O-methyltransferase Ste14